MGWKIWLSGWKIIQKEDWRKFVVDDVNWWWDDGAFLMVVKRFVMGEGRGQIWLELRMLWGVYLFKNLLKINRISCVNLLVQYPWADGILDEHSTSAHQKLFKPLSVVKDRHQFHKFHVESQFVIILFSYFWILQSSFLHFFDVLSPSKLIQLKLSNNYQWQAMKNQKLAKP